MKLERLQSCLIAAALALCIGWGGVGCMVSGFGLAVDMGSLLFACVLIAVAIAACLYLRRGGLILAGVWLVFALLAPHWEEWLAQWSTLLCKLFAYYRAAYGVPMPPWMQVGAEDLTLALLSLFALIASLTAGVVLRKLPAAFALVMGALPLISTMVVTDTVPDVLYLCITLAAMVLLVINQRVPNACVFLAVPVAIGMLVLSLFVPQNTYTEPTILASLDNLFRSELFMQTAEGDWVMMASGEVPEEVDLSQCGPRRYRNLPIMEVTAGRATQLYLRGRDYDHYDGKSWTSTQDRGEMYTLDHTFLRNQGTVSIRSFLRQSHYYLPWYPVNGALLSDGGVENPQKITEYTAIYAQLSHDWKTYYTSFVDSSGLASFNSFIDARYLELPEETRAGLAPILGELVETYGLKNYDSRDVAWRVRMISSIEHFVKNRARYDLETEAMPAGEDFALWFLEEADTGYCVHFATATTVLLRAMGIPARYVEGYTVTTEKDKPVVVRDKMAHAWVECYMPNLGWVIIESTPAASQEEEPTAPSAQTPTAPSVTAPTAPSQTNPTTTPTQTTAPSGGIGTDEGGSRVSPFVRIFVLSVGIIALLACLVTAQWWLRRAYILKLRHRGTPNQRAIARYREIRRMTKLCGVPVPKEITDLAEKARFSNHTLTREELACFDAYQKELETLLHEKPLPQRLIHRLIFAAY